MAQFCTKCGTQTMTMTGTIYLEPDAEPYESGKEEPSRTKITEVDKHIIANFCENCDEIAETFNE